MSLEDELSELWPNKTSAEATIRIYVIKLKLFFLNFDYNF